MSESQTFVLNPLSRGHALQAVNTAPAGHVVTVSEPTRNKQQNAALHAALQDIADQMQWHGKSLSVDVWKRLCTAACLREKGESVEMVPALDGKGFDVIYEPTSRMGVRAMSDLIEWVYKFGVENGVRFKDGHHAAA